MPLLHAVYGLESAILYEIKAEQETAKVLSFPRIGVKEDIFRPTPPTSLLKNTGLAHVHLMKNMILSKGPDGVGSSTTQAKFLPSIDRDVFGTLEEIKWPSSSKYMVDPDKDTYIQWSSARFLYCWGEFINRQDARQDPQYAVIKQTYDSLYGVIKKA
jgi:hypothetical protein